MITRYQAVQYELLRPAEVKARRALCPVVYIPVGSLEWHGVHNPLGTDGLKAHAICCEAALRYGGVVLPTLFLGILGGGRGWGPEGWDGYTVTAHDQASLEETVFRLARGLVADEWQVLVGVTGHDIEPQRDAIHDGIQRACRESASECGASERRAQKRGARGFGVTEGENWRGGASMRYSMDHAGAWETSAMLFCYGERVSLEALREQMASAGRTGVETMQMKEPEGVGGWNPLRYASAELGQAIVVFCAGRIGRKALDVLEGRIEPPEKADAAFMDNPGPTD
ncbi:MAG: creatininase family protein [Anaerolineae bacterium]|nr:creatininase family protein [Anaerolineae bacterium]